MEHRALGLARLSPQGGDLSALAPPRPLLCSRPWLLFSNLFTEHLVSAVLWGFLVNMRGAVLPPRPTQPSETHGPTDSYGAWDGVPLRVSTGAGTSVPLLGCPRQKCPNILPSRNVQKMGA